MHDGWCCRDLVPIWTVRFGVDVEPFRERVSESRLFRCCTGFQTPGAEERTCECRLAELKLTCEQDLNVCFRYGW